jgi:hypothetical protein
METSENTVRLHLAGSGTLIKSLRPDQVKVKLDLSKGIVGPNTYTITRENITLPPGVFLKKVEQPVVKVTLDVPVTKELPIQVDWIGELPNHIILKKIVLNPTKIKIEGGSQILNNISTIYTEKIQLNNIKQSGSLSASLVLSPASLKIVSGGKEKVMILYEVEKRM